MYTVEATVLQYISFIGFKTNRPTMFGFSWCIFCIFLILFLHAANVDQPKNIF